MSKEIGRIGQRRYGGVIYEEFLPELRGSRGVEIYREMSENDDVVGAILYAIEMLVRQTDWIVEPGGGTAKDREAAEFVQSCMDDMQSTWVDTVSEIRTFWMDCQLKPSANLPEGIPTLSCICNAFKGTGL